MGKERIAIKIGQVWESKRTGQQYLIAGKHGDKYVAKILTDKPDYYAGNHTMSRTTLRQKFKLLR